MSSIWDLNALELTEGFRSKTLSPVEVIRAVLERVERIDGKINAFIEVDQRAALRAAERSEERWCRGENVGLLDGIPISVKDLLDVEGMKTLYGSAALKPQNPANSDAASVLLLRHAGAVIFGKTTTSEFGNKIVTESLLSGLTRNPWNLDKSAGGSSGGAAAAVASGMGPLALATDGGGSIRIPANWCGVFGFKPSFKRVPSDGSDIFGLSNTGPITRTVEDAALMMSVLTGPYEGDWTLTPVGLTDFQEQLNKGVKGLRIALSKDLGVAKVPEEIATHVDLAAKIFSDLGARVEPATVPALSSYVQSRMHSVQWMVRLSQIVRNSPIASHEWLDPDTVELAKLGDEIPSAVLSEAMGMRQKLGRDMHRFFERYDLLIAPTFHMMPPDVPGLPPELQTAPPMTSWCNQTMQPAASIPCGLTENGLPVGMQIIGPRFADALVLRAARAFEVARGRFPTPRLSIN